MEKMDIEKLWESACCGENDKLKEYYENGGKINRRYRAFGKTHSLIAGAYRNGNLDTVDLLYKYGERPEAHEMDEIGFIPGYAILIIRTDGKRQYVPFASKENAYTIYHSLQNVAVDTKENIESLAVQCDNVIMEKINF